MTCVVDTTIVELLDWIATTKHIRGSRLGDNGIWIHSGAKPVAFCPKNRVVKLEDGSRFLLQKKTICKALGMDKTSELLLASLCV